MATLTEPKTTQPRSVLIVIFAGLLIGIAITNVIIAAHTPEYYQRVVSESVPTVTFADLTVTSNALVAESAAMRGLTLSQYALYQLTLMYGTTLVWWAAGGLVLWNARRDWYRWFVAFFLFFFPGGYLVEIMRVTEINGPLFSLGSLLWSGVGLFLYLFPNGQASPRRVLWLLLPIAGIHFVLQAIGVAAESFPSPAMGNAFQIARLFAPIILLAFPIALVSQIYRYWRISTPAERSQTKWVVAGLAAAIIPAQIIDSIFGAASAFNDPGYSADISQLLLLFLPLSFTIAILRSRLWDIDVVIRRTLQYSLLSGLLALVYFGGVIVLQSIFTTITGQSQSPLVTVLSTLAIAALFLPLRRRVQDFIDKRFYRRKYDAAKVIADFAATARDETDLDKLTARLVEVVDETMQPESVGLWLKPDALNFSGVKQNANASLQQLASGGSEASQKNE